MYVFCRGMIFAFEQFFVDGHFLWSDSESCVSAKFHEVIQRLRLDFFELFFIGSVHCFIFTYYENLGLII